MSLEVINTIAALTTVIIVAAAAVAALVQLRHLRAGNQINAMLSIGERLGGHEYREAINVVRRHLEQALQDPAFRDYEITLSRGHGLANVDPQYVRLRDAAIVVGNTLEELGILVKRGVVDRDMFLDRYCGVIVDSWDRMKDFTALGRAATGMLAAWENFEYLTVLSQDWLEQHPSAYPSGTRRIPLQCPWPVPPLREAS